MHALGIAEVCALICNIAIRSTFYLKAVVHNALWLLYIKKLKVWNWKS